MLRRSLSAPLLCVPLLLVACSAPDGAADRDGDAARQAEASAPHVEASSPAEAGRYLVKVAGCNDCHTAGYLREQGQVPREEWLRGSRVGFQGPWGTTYPNNLRRAVQRMSEEDWVEMFATRTQKPPMPWFNLHAMSERDARAIYRFVQTLGEPGDSVPAPLPPGEEPSTPYYDFVPQAPGGS